MSTPIPWSTGTDEDAHIIYGPDLQFVAGTDDGEGDAEREVADAELIVLAVNNHAELLAMCKRLLAAADSVGGYDYDTSDDFHDAIVAAGKLISKVEGEQT